MSTIQQNSTNFDDQTRVASSNQHVKLNELIELVRSKLKVGNRLDAKMLDLNEFCDEVQTMFKRLKEMLTKVIHLHDELERKEAQARLVNESIAELPKLFDEMIEHYQVAEAEQLVKLKENLTKLAEEIERLEDNLAANEHMMNECLDERKEHQVQRARLNEELNALESKLRVLLSELNDSKQINDKLNADWCRSVDEQNRVRREFDQLNKSLNEIEQRKGELRMELDERTVRFNELKEKKQSLLNGTYADEAIKKVKMQLDKRREELNRIQRSIEEIKSKSVRSSHQIKLPRMKDEHLQAHVKALLMRLVKLIELNYQHQYMVFEGGCNPTSDP